MVNKGNFEASEIVIIGAGVLGLSISYQLAKDGIKSTVIEMDSIGAKASGKADG
ncbi:FAD-dependent oxidoreductase, partial [Chloroflexota bacterium]